MADNASSMVKAFDVCLPGFHVAEAEDISYQDQEETDVIEEEINMEDVLKFLPERMSCFAHTQQLCVKDGLTNPEVKNSFLSTAIQKTSSLVNSVRKSTSAAPFLQEKGIHLQSPNVTRWNSQLKMIKSVLKGSEHINKAVDLLSGKENKNKKLTAMEVSALREVVTVLNPFKEAMEQVEGEKMVTISAIGPVIIGLQQSMQQLIESNLSYCETLARVLLGSVKRRLNPFLEMTDITAAAVFDPRFKLNWLPSEEKKRTGVSRNQDPCCRQ